MTSLFPRIHPACYKCKFLHILHISDLILGPFNFLIISVTIVRTFLFSLSDYYSYYFCKTSRKLGVFYRTYLIFYEGYFQEFF